MEKININEKFSQVKEYWHPHIIGELNGQHVKAGKQMGEFVWHFHENEDELFLVVEGQLEMHFRDKVVLINPGEFIIVPRGVEHKPVAKIPTSTILFEPAGTLNTGNVKNELTKETLNKI
jgi:mannose-6-phosphate isomerase-like protein (cupin superfamily)